MKFINLALGLLLVLAMAAQVNDPDPWIWIALYGGVGLLCGFAAFKFINRWVLYAVGLFILIGIIILWPVLPEWIARGTPPINDEMKDTHPYIEEVRELFGLCLCAVIVIFLIFQERFQRKKTTS
jgi:hypothetical protein